MALPGGLSIKSLTGLMFLFIGLLLQVIGISTPEWSVSQLSSTDHFGLWTVCDENECQGISGSSKSAEMLVCQTFAVLSTLAAVAGLVVGLLHFLLAILGQSHSRQIQLVSFVVSLGSLFFALICVATWGAGVHEGNTYRVGYSFILSIIGGVLTTGGALLVFVSATLFVR